MHSRKRRWYLRAPTTPVVIFKVVPGAYIQGWHDLEYPFQHASHSFKPRLRVLVGTCVRRDHFQEGAPGILYFLTDRFASNLRLLVSVIRIVSQTPLLGNGLHLIVRRNVALRICGLIRLLGLWKLFWP